MQPSSQHQDSTTSLPGVSLFSTISGLSLSVDWKCSHCGAYVEAGIMHGKAQGCDWPGIAPTNGPMWWLYPPTTPDPILQVIPTLGEVETLKKEIETLKKKLLDAEQRIGQLECVIRRVRGILTTDG